ncbi:MULTISPECIES: substrate-binding domain-containing protein [Kitasatospora]|uniref:Putative phosphate ABC transporter substrate-binding protein n=1 Tax=Kitasatospora setae (strain ATCC 33774 / DSM 43861 / JCM 3304 / KCC A-0304 / NBRC 14216 / KM-6054) TaxID=452652 RepID=E4N6P3_KITSK|nr:substrate-binding domain-containing protein [Kitasatospora setae]BAJ26874.1 putative phosphate ABC transporter substrate-binding protein [Kitasatospora setae KM-6054]
MRLRHLASALLTAALALPTALLGAAPAHAATSLNADGSSWAGPAIDQWRRDVGPMGIEIDFNPVGSAAGRVQWAAGQDDFTASDVPFRSRNDSGVDPTKQNGGLGGAENPQYGYSYVPITAGGTALMYHLELGGKKITDLRLSPDTIVGIFTNRITSWDDPKITADYGKALPKIPITPVVRSDGSGATAQFTRWMQHTHQGEWEAYCTRVNGVPCGDYTEFFPPSGRMTAQNGSDVVAGYIQSPTGIGAIGYDEYAFAKRSNWPVVKVLNPAGYYTLPTASNVAVALTAARIRGVDDNTSPNDPDYLQQNLDAVYSNNDARSYPISSYSYLIVPRAGAALPVAPRFNDTKGNALSRYLAYVLCAGQGEADELGYSPIPRNLVRGGLLQTQHIPGNASPVDPNSLNNCPNPTFNSAGELTVLKNAPQPSPCDKAGSPLNCTVQNGQAVKTGSGSGSGTSGGSGSGSGTGGTSGGSGTGTATGSGGASGGAGTGAGTSGGSGSGSGDGSQPVVDPQTGELLASDGGGGGSNGGGGAAPAQVVALGGRPQDWLLSSLTAVELLGVVTVPPLLAAWWRRRDRTAGNR